MAFKTDQRIGITRGYSHGESGENVANTLDENFRIMSILLQASVLSATVTTPPTTPTDGDAYIIPPGASGVWFFAVGKLAQYDKSQSGWVFLTVKKGFSIFVDDVDQQWVYTASGWKVVAFQP